MANKKPKKLPIKDLRLHEPESLITFRVSVLSQLLSRVVEASVGNELGVSSRQWRVLVMLNRLGPSTSGQVALATHLDHSQVSRASHELAEKGLVNLGSDGKDRRRQVLTLTAMGTALLRQGVLGSQARQARLSGCMSAAEYASLGKALAALSAEAHTMLAELKREGNSAPEP